MTGAVAPSAPATTRALVGTEKIQVKVKFLHLYYIQVDFFLIKRYKVCSAMLDRIKEEGYKFISLF